MTDRKGGTLTDPAFGERVAARYPKHWLTASECLPK
ncbi:Uncharacterised protein [Mycobacteroides abscessus subsp. abscessus]|nr:Uncharacterised protein [Mycobacteroides abscessus subsp. abscessus]